MAEGQRLTTRFRELHERPGLFVMPNPWDAGTAKILAGLGYEALRAHLSTLVNLMRAAVLCRVGIFDLGIAQLDREFERSEAQRPDPLLLSR